MNKYIIYYENKDYGYYTTEIDADTIDQALEEFIEDWAYEEIYGIMMIR